MSNIIKACIYGTVQGLTEFLPVSSSGHLVLLHDFLPLDLSNEVVFDVVLHFGTLLAVIFYFRNDILKIITSFFKGDKLNQKLGIYLVLATIPAGLAGYFFDDLITLIFRSSLVVVLMLIVIGIFFIISEKISSRKFNLFDINLAQALIIGFAQVVALIPGTSRSGITIVAGLFLGLKREAAARFSFLLSIPVILGAVVMQIPKISIADGDNTELFIFLVAFISAVFSGLWAIKFFLNFIGRHKLNTFAYYRFVLALVVLAYMFVSQ
jgi:undecaprenyl-diphosphatase